MRAECTTAKVNRKIIQRSENTEYVENNAKRVAQSGSLYKKRQALVEHPFGTMKRQWGFDHIMTKKGIKRASADVGLIAIAYNLRRMINILGTGGFEEQLKQAVKGLFNLICDLINPISQKTSALFTFYQVFENIQFIKHKETKLSVLNLIYID
jgi:hypothetical protein